MRNTLPPDDSNANGVASRHRDDKLQTKLQAEPLQRRALTTFEKAYGDGHEYTISAANNLAATLESIGRLEDANKIYALTLDNMIKLHGPSHKLTAKP